MEAANPVGNVVDPPSTVGLLNAAPFVEVIPFALQPVGYLVNKMKQAGGHPVFHTTFGVESVVLTDHLSTEFFLCASTDVLDREDAMALGPLSMNGCECPGCECPVREIDCIFRAITFFFI